MQDVMGNIREAMYERDWTNGTEKNAVAHAKIISPIAVTSMQLDHVSRTCMSLSERTCRLT